MVQYVNVFGLFHATRKQLYVSAAVFTAVIILIIGLSVGLSGKDQPSHHEEIGFNGRDALNHAPLVDGHNDLPWSLYAKLNNNLSAFNFDQDLSEDSVWGKAYCSSCHTDLSRLIKGKVGAQFWAAYTSCKSQYKDSIQLTLRQIDVIKRLINKYSSNLELVINSFDIENVWKSGKIASMIGVEGGHSIDSSLAVLRLYYELGVRYLTLTHSCNTPWADGSPMGNSSLHDLTDFGVKVIHEMNRLGMLVDLSHVSHNVMRHVLAVTKAPVIFSHSSAFAICNNYRNVPDDVLQLVKKNNGIVMVNFYSGFVNCNPSRNATMRDVVDHINYIRNLIGVDHVGIGADYDGVDKMPEGLDDVSKYPNLFDRLHTNVDNEPYWSQEDLEKLAGRNLIRVFSAVEAVRDSLSSESPYEDVIDGQELYNAQLSENLTPGECQTAIEWDSIMTTTTEATSTIGSSTTDSSTIGSSTVEPSVSSSTTLPDESKPEQ